MEQNRKRKIHVPTDTLSLTKEARSLTSGARKTDQSPVKNETRMLHHTQK